MNKQGNKKAFDVRRERLHEIIFEADTKAGRNFDIILLFIILLSVIVVMLETVPALERYNRLFIALEWVFTIVFTIEYALRLYCVHKPMKYVKSFYGVIDLLAILPTYISLFVYGPQSLAIIRALRLLRVFRIFKMWSFLQQGAILTASLKAARAKIFLFLFAVLIMVCIFGSIMYLVEGGVNEKFDSIPRSIYWAIVTLTTVGYGDISPQTPVGQFLSAIVMLIGYAVIAVPTGIVSAEFVRTRRSNDKKIITNSQVCRYCSKEGHADDAIFCKYCGEALSPLSNND